MLPIKSARINRAHPLSAHLIFAASPQGSGWWRDLVTGTPGAPGLGHTEVIRESGRSSKGNDASSGMVRFSMPERFRHFAERDFTIVLYGNYDGPAGSYQTLLGMSGNPNWFSLENSGTSIAQISWDEGNIYGKKSVSVSTSLASNADTLWVVKRKGQTLELSLGAGAFKSEVALSHQQPMTTAELIFHGGDIGTRGAGTIHAAYIFDVPLTDSQLAGILANPFDLLMSQRLIPFVEAGGGGGVDASAALSGVSASAGVGSLSIFTDATQQITGVIATGAAGALIVSTGANDTAILSGVEAMGQAGSLFALSSPTVAISGVVAVSQAGDLIILNGSGASITGVTASGAVGGLSIQSDVTLMLSGIDGSGEVGALGLPEDGGASVTGVQASGEAGVLTVKLTGVWEIQEEENGTWSIQPVTSKAWTIQ